MSTHWENVQARMREAYQRGIERLKAISLFPVDKDHLYFKGDSGAWYSLPFYKMIDAADTDCIASLNPLKMPDGWFPSYRVDVWGHGDTESTSNGVRVPSWKEAEAYAKDLYSRWTGMKKFEIVGCDEAANYTWKHDQLVRLIPFECGCFDLTTCSHVQEEAVF